MTTAIINLPRGVRVILHPDNRRIVLDFPDRGTFDDFDRALTEARKSGEQRYQEFIGRHPDLAGNSISPE